MRDLPDLQAQFFLALSRKILKTFALLDLGDQRRSSNLEAPGVTRKIFFSKNLDQS